MEKIDFKDIYVDAILEEIKSKVREKINLEMDDVQDISGDKVEIADQMMREVLKDILLNKENNPNSEYSYNFLLLDDREDNEAKKTVRRYLTLYYTALYFDNVSLLQKLIREGVAFWDDYHDLQLGILDSDISSAFSEEKYVEVVKKMKASVILLYNSIKDKEYSIRKNRIKKFSNIINKRQDILDEKVSSEIWGNNRLDIYDEETYLKGTKEQLNNIVAKCDFYKNEDNRVHANRLIQDTDFTATWRCETINMDMFFENFTEEELRALNPVEVTFFGKIFNYCKDVEIVRIKRLFEVRRALAKYPYVFTHTDDNFLEVFTDKEILNLSEEILAEFDDRYYHYFPSRFDKKAEAKVKMYVSKNNMKNIFSLGVKNGD